MPARIPISDEEIKLALSRTGGAITAGARMLGISVRTLQRRLSTNPSLFPDPPFDPAWVNAERATDLAALLYEVSFAMRKFAACGAYLDKVEWTTSEIELEPRQLNSTEIQEYLADINLLDVRLLSVSALDHSRSG